MKETKGTKLAPNVMTASIRERLWHTMRQDLSKYVPEIAANRVLMCCSCGRFLTQEWFDLEHLIPQQALKLDPEAVRANPDTPANVRAGNLLLCKRPLKYKGTSFYPHGCNSWKGRYYDKPISDLFHGEAWKSRSCTEIHIRAGLALAYLAMVAEFGYAVVLMQSGLLMREQFFSIQKFHPALPMMSQVLFGGGDFGGAPLNALIWTKPFAFGILEGKCTVTARNFAVTLPLTRDPRDFVARRLRYLPTRFIFRPDFRTVFE